jgi:hypothetical protein
MQPTRHKKYYAAHKEQVRSRLSAYYPNPKSKYTRLKSRAKKLGHKFTLTFEDYLTLIASGLCFYCRGPLSKTGGDLDRMDNKQGYTQLNCVACCGMKNGKRSLSCNVRKGHLEAAGFVYPQTVELLMDLLEEATE